jgi:phosphoribosylanthranilate isomerase
MTFVKICGLTNLADARCAARAGADFLGFIFYPPSPRYVTPAKVGEILDQLRTELGRPTPRAVGVFVNAPVADVRTIMAQAHLDLAQLHGEEPATDLRALGRQAFKAIRPQTPENAQRALATYAIVGSEGVATLPQLLVDAYHPEAKGGTGQRANLEIAEWLAHRCRLLLAGGLTPGNVRDAVTAIQPWGVDVASGVESAKGVKGHRLVERFVQAAKQTPGS